MHLGVTLLLPVLGRGRRRDDRGIHDRAGADLQSVILQVLGNQFKQPSTQVVGLQQMAELVDRGLVGHGYLTQIDARETAHRPRVVQDLLHRWVRQSEPVLQKLDAQHHLQLFRRATCTLGLWVKRFYNLAQFTPWQNRVHLHQKLFPARHLAVAFKGFVGKGLYGAYGNSPGGMIDTRYYA